MKTYKFLLAFSAVAIAMNPSLRAESRSDEPGFVAKLSLDLSAAPSTNELIWSMGPVRLFLREAGKDAALAAFDLKKANYLSHAYADGRCPVVEATISEKAGRIGLPLSILRTSQPCEVTLRYSPPRWRIESCGDADEDYPLPLTPIAWKDSSSVRVRSTRVLSESLDTTKSGYVPPTPDYRPVNRPIQYWTPDGFNTWVGDVAPATLNGVLHVFYLKDRRHHGSGEGKGRHQFAHLVSEDLVHWNELPIAVPITEFWQTVGTGTPFLKDGKVAIAFGWHTSRFCEPTPEHPMGGTYAISDDGIHFTWPKVMISDAQNPSIYNKPDGVYELVTSYGGSIGIFRSTDLKDWKLVDDKLPFRGDCPSLFDWHGHRYLLQGFRNMAYSPDGKAGSFVNWSDRPDKLYEGLAVPMVASWKDDRRLYIGWLNHLYGWGGWLVFREVVAFPDGVLGLKWVPEIEPPTQPVTFEVKTGEKFVRRLIRTNGESPDLLFAIDREAKTVTFVDDVPNAEFKGNRRAENVRIGGVRGIEGAFRVRLIVHYDRKANATIFDAEIAGTRTIICRREGRYALQ